ncbi:hypothetical protein L9F63_023158, partial [Diploptera punctata]
PIAFIAAAVLSWTCMLKDVAVVCMLFLYLVLVAWLISDVYYIQSNITLFTMTEFHVWSLFTLTHSLQICNYLKLKGHKLGGIFKFRQPVLVLRDPEIIKAVIVKEFSSFQDNDFHSNINIDPLLGRNPFVLRGNIWKESRSKLTPAFTNMRLKPVFPVVQEVCSDLMEYLNESCKSGKECLVEAKELSTKFTADSVANCAYGLKQNSFKNPDSEFRKYGRIFLEPTIWKGIEQGCVILAPRLADFLRFKFTPTEVIEFFRRTIKETVDYRKNNNVVRNDYLQLLIQLQDKAQDANKSDDKSIPWYKKFTDEDIAAQALTFFLDGYETSSSALTVVLHNLACYPAEQKNLQEEVDSKIEENDGKLTFDALQTMSYLDMVLNESLRMHPAVPYMNRLCTKPFEVPLSDGKTLKVEVGTPVVTPILGIHHDPEYYPDSRKFIPERFTEENKATRPKYTHFPFGEGPRICLGMRFAQMQIKALVSTILSEYNIEKTENTRISDTYTDGLSICTI